MPLLIDFGLLVLGFVILIWAGDWLVRGAAALARHWGVPALIVGLTIVAFGTSAPELVVSIQAVLNNTGELAAGNIIGSNIANVFLALGAPALILAIPTHMPGVARNTVIALLATLVFIGLILINNPLQTWQGSLLFAGIIIYLIGMFHLGKSGSDDPILAEMTELEEGESGLPSNMLISFVFVILGMVGLGLGGNMIVENATSIATALNVSDTIIGLTIVAIGTSLPEVATVIIAARQGHSDVAIGNVLGSNVFNLLAVGGAAAMVGPVLIEDKILAFDLWIMLAAIIILLGYVMTRRPIGRKTGLLFVIAYILYLCAIGHSMM